MADQPTNPRIEELRNRLGADPKSRLFYPLAEELRKLKRFDDAERTLREGLVIHTSYMSAWISLGRVLRALHKNGEAIEVLEKALVLDPGNVVAARLLAEAYEETGDTVQAVQKYKLVAALLPADEEVTDKIARLEAEIEAAEGAETERVSLREADVPVFDQTADMPRPMVGDESTEEPVVEEAALEVPSVETPESADEVAAREEPVVEGSGFVEEEEQLPSDTTPMAVMSESSATAEATTFEEPPVPEEETRPETEGAESSPFDETLPPFAETEPGEVVDAGGDVFAATPELETEFEAEEGGWEPSGPVEDEPIPQAETTSPVDSEEAPEAVAGIVDESRDSAGSIRRRKIERLERWVAKVGVKGRGGDHL